MSLEKALITNTVTGTAIPVQFNPEDYTLNREITYAQAAIPGLSAPLLQFVNGNLQTLEMELFVDSWEEHKVGSRVVNAAQSDVRLLTRQVTDLMNIEPSTHAPPVLLFTWGSLSFTCVLSRAGQKFVMFRPDGIPVRARLTVAFSEYRNVELEAKEVKRETADYSKRHVVSQGETLSSIAAREYGDPKLWRVIAIANRLQRARGLEPGLQLRLPRLPYRDPDSGRVIA
ncbi:peptigoglycan-binding protein LysM [Schlegelella sp. S2-27]|uniref:Peptigoglycan-binding protein LysM n=1 Tax=Caldimonas mangrovi TaxID=2944811 RepID=A0ABT0YP39_9BURK|nr:peptigoglycan-binding protein LysM [Caldimonas mangrovi]MCM5680486.1 peptigoglycan-binding protein LysM [Caldimonas mangrovi]